MKKDTIIIDSPFQQNEDFAASRPMGDKWRVQTMRDQLWITDEACSHNWLIQLRTRTIAILSTSHFVRYMYICF